MPNPSNTDSRELDSILEQYFHYKITEKDRQDPLYKGLIEWRNAYTANKQREVLDELEKKAVWIYVDDDEIANTVRTKVVPLSVIKNKKESLS